MTYTLTLTPYLAAMLDAACRSTGLDTLNIFPSVLNRSGYTIPAAVLPTQHPAAAIPPAPVYEPEPESVEDFLAGIRLR